MAEFETLDPVTLISRKICVMEKFCKFHNTGPQCGKMLNSLPRKFFLCEINL